MEDYKYAFGISAIILTFIAFFPYIRSVLKSETKPHFFSWVIWGTATTIVFFAQFLDNGGAGSWSIGISGLITFFVAYLAYNRRQHIRIYKTDYLSAFIALIALISWVYTSNALFAVIILTILDISGFVPTFKKSYLNPHSENQSFYFLIMLRNIISIIALENYTIVTILFPLSIAIACLVFLIMVNIVRSRGT